jgi:hypothetical protein
VENNKIQQHIEDKLLDRCVDEKGKANFGVMFLDEIEQFLLTRLCYVQRYHAKL